MVAMWTIKVMSSCHCEIIHLFIQSVVLRRTKSRCRCHCPLHTACTRGGRTFFFFKGMHIKGIMGVSATTEGGVCTLTSLLHHRPLKMAKRARKCNNDEYKHRSVMIIHSVVLLICHSFLIRLLVCSFQQREPTLLLPTRYVDPEMAGSIIKMVFFYHKVSSSEHAYHERQPDPVTEEAIRNKRR